MQNNRIPNLAPMNIENNRIPNLAPPMNIENNRIPNLPEPAGAAPVEPIPEAANGNFGNFDPFRPMALGRMNAFGADEHRERLAEANRERERERERLRQRNLERQLANEAALAAGNIPQNWAAINREERNAEMRRALGWNIPILPGNIAPAAPAANIPIQNENRAPLGGPGRRNRRTSTRRRKANRRKATRKATRRYSRK